MNKSSEVRLPILSETTAEDPGNERLVPKLFRYLKILRDFVRLLFGLLLDPRVDKKVKIFAGSVLVYVFSPIDFIPELFTGLFGMLDDFVLSALAINVILNWVDPEIVKSHWRGEGDLLQTIQKAIKNAEILIPEAILKKIEGWIGKHAVRAIVQVQPTPPAPKKPSSRKSKQQAS